MPFDVANGVLTGDDAATPGLWARDEFVAWLKNTLNDAPFAAKLGVTAQRRAIVTPNRKIARNAFSMATAPPVVFVYDVQIGAWTRGGKRIGGVQKRGKRYEISLLLDMGIGDATPNAVDVVNEERDDSMLPALVADAINKNYETLCEKGFNNPVFAATQDQSGGGRYPHSLSFFVIALDE